MRVRVTSIPFMEKLIVYRSADVSRHIRFVKEVTRQNIATLIREHREVVRDLETIILEQQRQIDHMRTLIPVS